LVASYNSIITRRPEPSSQGFATQPPSTLISSASKQTPTDNIVEILEKKADSETAIISCFCYARPIPEDSGGLRLYASFLVNGAVIGKGVNRRANNKKTSCVSTHLMRWTAA